MNKKNQTLWQILNGAILLDMQNGHLNWSFSELARTSSISRTTIYYYFGKTKIYLLQQAVDIFSRELSGDTHQRLEAWKNGRIVETLIESRMLVKNCPDLPSFYFFHRLKDTEIGKTIRNKENNFKKKILKFLPHISRHEVDSVFSVMLGIIFTAELSDENIQWLLQKILST
ncbi:MAG: TetR/AcrR family transcriptional regulator [Pseudobdellovibrionaceae bacterium]